MGSTRKHWWLGLSALCILSVPTAAAQRANSADAARRFKDGTAALARKDYERAVAAAAGVNPEQHSNRAGRAAYRAYYGRALARIRGRQDDAVRALRQAELIVPHRVQRDPFVREVLAELLARSRRDAIGRELRGMAFRAGLPL